MALDFDPYAVLGLSADATDAQIAQARRQLSREYHPDVNGAADAAERFSQIQRAFELLSDPAARAEYDRTGSRLGAARMARGRGTATEAAPAIFIEPDSVDFGILEPGQPAVDAQVTIFWAGASPGRIKSDHGNEWWTNLSAEMPDPSCVVFSLRAQAHAGAPNGRHHDQFTVTLDDTAVAVRLTAEIRGVPPAPPPRTFEPAGHAPPVPGRPALPGWVGPVVVLLILAAIGALLATHVFSLTGT
jgi:hypothetical protein